jgi:exosortase family protein XrtF
LKSTIKQYKPFLLFLIKFFVTYIVLTVVYQLYLRQYSTMNNEVDGITQLVANQTEWLLQLVNDKSYIEPHLTEPSVKLIYNEKYIARIIEGCNAVSVIILFVAFVIAFTGRIRHTVGFIVVGILIVHFLNIIRIALLAIALYHYPESEHLLHGVLFPLVIYGVVFLLWVIWVNKFSKHV